MASTPHQLRGGTAADQVTVRRNNLSVVLTHLRESGPRSRARVADDTGLNKATVSSLVAELVQRGLVREGATERGAIGRPGQEISLDGRHLVSLGVEINIDFVSALAMDLTGHVVAERRVALDTSHMQPGPVLKRLARLVGTMLTSLQASGARTVGLGIAVPGIVESASGTLDEAPNLGWVDVPVGAHFRTLIGEPSYPVVVENEANLAALAEISRRASDGDARTLRAIADIGTWLGRGASILVNIFNPEVLVLGGYFAALGPWLAGPLDDALTEQVLAPKAGGCRVELSTLGFSAAVRGGALQALESVFSDPGLVPVVEAVGS